jgi:hypothetical protein
MWVNAKKREKNKEKHVNGAMFLTVYHCQVYPLDEFSSTCVDLVSDYVENVQEDPTAGPPQYDLPEDGSDDEMWVNLGVNLGLTE